MAAGRDRWPRKEFRSCTFTAKSLPPDAIVRCAIGLAADWPGNNQIAWQKCKLAMVVRGSSNHYLLSQIRRRHWIKHGEITGLGQQEVESIIEELLAATPGVIERLLGCYLIRSRLN